MLLVEPTITVRVIGAFSVVLPTASFQPTRIGLKGQDDGLRIETQDLCVGEAAGIVAVNLNSRYDGYSWSGAVKDPLATPTKFCSVCE